MCKKKEYHLRSGKQMFSIHGIVTGLSNVLLQIYIKYRFNIHYFHLNCFYKAKKHPILVFWGN